MPKYFGTNGIRGLYDFLNPEFALNASFAFGKWSQEKFGASKNKTQDSGFKTSIKIGVGRDMRLTSPAIHSACLAGIMSSGADAVDLGLVSSPTAEVMIHHLGLSGAIIVTASHNPPEWNALKFVDKNDIAISKERGEEIEKLIDEGEKTPAHANAGSQISYQTASVQHMALIRKRINPNAIKKRNPKIILDCGNGTANLIAPALFSELGCEVKVLNEKIDGRFPGRPSEPTEANLKELIGEVKKEKADLGIAYDGDSDRVIFICHKGNFIVGDRGFALSAKLALEKNKSTAHPVVVTTVATSNVVKDVCEEFKAKLHYTKVGAPYIAEEMWKSKAISGGEEVGGIVWPELSLAKDGFFAAAKIIEAICVKETTLSAMLNELPQYYNSKTKIPCEKGIDKQGILAKVAKKLKEKGLSPLLLDGVRIDYKDSWAIIRASGTEDYFRVFAEAKSQKEADELMEMHKEMLKEMLMHLMKN